MTANAHPIYESRSDLNFLSNIDGVKISNENNLIIIDTNRSISNRQLRSIHLEAYNEFLQN